MSDVRSELPASVRTVLFNLAEVVETDLDVVNASQGFKTRIDAPMEALENYLNEMMPQHRDLLLAHVSGEFGESERAVDAGVTNLLHRIRSFELALDDHAPDFVFLWNQFNVFHRIAAEILTRRGIAFGFFHDGLLPGSIAFDFDGEMGNSWIARQPERFRDVAVTDAEVARAEAFIEGLGENEASARHVQRDDVIVEEALKLKGLQNRPVLFLAGQNDWHAGVKPYSPETARHSPVFNGSTEALHALDVLGGEVGFSVLYKPHPLCRDRYLFLDEEAHPNSLVLKSTSLQACMKASFLVSTIASQTCYAAILEGHPVMMLGRNQISDKGLTYDVHLETDIVNQIERGMSDPLAETRRHDLARHVAQLERCYLLDYGTMSSGYFRRGAKSAAWLLMACLENSTEEMVKMQAAGALQ